MKRSLLPICLLGMALLHQANCCSEPVGYENLPKKTVLENQDLVILAKFREQNNSEEDVNGYNRPILRLRTEVECILQNKNNVNVGSEIQISEIRPGGFYMVPACTDYFCCLRFDSEAIISIRPSEDLPGEFEFMEYNLQGHTYYTDNSDFKDGQWVGWFGQKNKVGEGTCPTSKVNKFSGKSNGAAQATFTLALFLPGLTYFLYQFL